MGENDDLRVLIKERFNDLGNNMKKQAGILSELKDEMKSTREELNGVKASVKTNKTEIKSNQHDISGMKEQLDDLISSDQDRRRRGGRR